jgi:recombination DNA repair RAD52 pathway protein
MDIIHLKTKDSNRIETYADKDKVDQWAYEAVKKTVGSGVFNGTTANTLDPQSTFTYAEAATAIRNLLLEAQLIND